MPLTTEQFKAAIEEETEKAWDKDEYQVDRVSLQQFAKRIVSLTADMMQTYDSERCNLMHPSPRAGYLERCIQEKLLAEELKGALK
jgi:hypothetical protein